MLTPFQLQNVVRLQVTHALDVGQREGIGFAADFNHQAAHHRKGQWHFDPETTALACPLLQFDAAVHLANHVLHGVKADTAPGNLRDLVAHAETRQEQKAQQFFFAHLFGGFGR
ncbi:hypothetical protein AN901_203854 [Pseudomonas syringae pv. theae]|nr:hypothetical protein AN901_203854 [Pseudomonas syringae pv. theae]